MNRWLTVVSICIGLHFITTASEAGEYSPANEPQSQSSNSSVDRYRGHTFDLAAIAGQQNYQAIVDALHHQIDIVEGAGLSEHLLQIFRHVQIVVDDLACLERTKEWTEIKKGDWACYGPFPSETFQAKSLVQSHLWDNKLNRSKSPEAEFAFKQEANDLANSDEVGRGVIMVRPLTFMIDSSARVPFLLHELLHYYHLHVLPNGEQFEPIMVYYEAAKDRHLYPEKDYVLRNKLEFFAVTASIFLYGTDDLHAPYSRRLFKEAQPDYYNFLVWLFGLDPDSKSGAPVASAD